MTRNARNTLSILTALAATSLAAGAQISFSGPTTLATAQRPDGVTGADFNGDGNADLAVTVDNVPDLILILLGDGAGNFTPGTSILTGPGTGPASIVATDVDGDGDPDIAVVLNNISRLQLYTNTAGAFAPGASAALGAEARRLQAGDIDGDGDTDFATANRDSNTVTAVLYQAGTLTPTEIPVGDEPRGLALGDFNGDTRADLAVARRNNRDIGIFMNTGSTFGPATSLPVNPLARPAGVAAGDIDGDGDIDVATAISDDIFPNAVTVFSNNGGTLAFTAEIETGGLNPDTLAIADFDNDGDGDIAVSNQDSNTVSVITNDAGVFAAMPPMNVGALPGDLFVGDLNGDTTPDIAVTSRDSNTTSVFLNATVVVEPCAGDLNDDQNATIVDLLIYLDGFFPADPAADFDGNGTVNIMDLLAFLEAWFAGC